MSYNSLLTYGDFITLSITCNVNKLFEEVLWNDFFSKV